MWVGKTEIHDGHVIKCKHNQSDQLSNYLLREVSIA